MIQAEAGCVIGRDYPEPIVDLVASSRFARDTVWGVRDEGTFRQEAQAVFEQHGSRNPNRNASNRSGHEPAAKQKRKAAPASLAKVNPDQGNLF